MSHQADNIFAGTQVVSLVEVRGTNNSLVHPRGAVGVVTRTPAVEGERFLVRFQAGVEVSMSRTKRPEHSDYDLPRRSCTKAGAANRFRIKMEREMGTG